MRLLPKRIQRLYVSKPMDSHMQIYPCTPTNSYRHLHMHTHPFTFTTHTYCCIQILLFFYSCFSHKTYYLFVPLYSHVIFKCFITICNSALLHFWYSAPSCEQELNKCSLSFGSWMHLAQLLSWYFPWILFFRFVILVRSLNITTASDVIL